MKRVLAWVLVLVMALGLFASLLIGTIFGTVYKYTEWEMLNVIATYAKAAKEILDGLGNITPAG